VNTEAEKKQNPAPMRRILFVDDDPNVLAGLRNVLRPQRREWDMVFALGPEEALSKVESEAFDVVVSDMRMPKMDGATLLTEIKRRQPKTVRMILTGQTEQESVLKSVFIAHMFLAKPCEPTLLRRVVERACRLNDILNDEDLKAAAGKVEMLPAAPKTYVALNEALMSPNCSVTDVSRVIERDVGLCAKILQLVNSAFFGLPRRISSLTEAVSYIGTATIKNLAMALEAFSSGARSSGLTAAELDSLQHHSLLAGQIARRIEVPDKSKAEEAFLAGVLHEVGRLVPVDQRAMDDRCLTIDHPLLGGYLLGLWGLPHPIIEAVAYHREPRMLPHSEPELTDAVYIAHSLAAEVGNEPNVPKLDLDYLGKLGIEASTVDGMREIARGLVTKVPGAREARDK
jgi:HD-like signal output (HDOD) protein